MTYYSYYKVNMLSYARSLLMFYSLRHIAPESKFTHALHLDLFEHLIPPSLIGEVLTETHGWEEREKALNMPMVIAIIIAMGLFTSCSIPHVLHKLAQGLRYIWPDPRLHLPGASAISQRRQQLGVLPLRRLFERVCQPRATHETPGAFAFGLRLMAIDSTVEKVADTFANALTFGTPSNQHGTAAYPQVRGIYLLECATHLIVDALFRPYRPHELQGAFALLRSIRPGMLVLQDRGFHAARLILLIRAMRAHVLGRLPSHVVPHYLRQLADGTYLAYLYPEDDTGKQQGQPLLVRIIEYHIDDAQRPGRPPVLHGSPAYRGPARARRSTPPITAASVKGPRRRPSAALDPAQGSENATGCGPLEPADTSAPHVAIPDPSGGTVAPSPPPAHAPRPPSPPRPRARPAARHDREGPAEPAGRPTGCAPAPMGDGRRWLYRRQRSSATRAGTAARQSAVMPTSAVVKTGADGSGLMARIVPAERTPTMWLNFPDSPMAT